MAKRSSRLRTQRDYKNALKQLRGKIRFDYDLRRNLTRGQKSAISRALNQLPTDQTTRFIQPARRRGESGTAFAKRIRIIKRNSGQDGSAFTGVWAKVPKGGKTSFKGGRLRVSIPAQNYAEEHRAINNRAMASDRKRAAYLRRKLKQFERQGFTGVAFRMGTGRTIEFEIDELGLINEFFSNWAAKYGQAMKSMLFGDVLNGFILTVRP